tara:strand:+ start:10522 stop:10665 length:144 start_codon:yes stop_codon:yes gene_type:complete
MASLPTQMFSVNNKSNDLHKKAIFMVFINIFSVFTTTANAIDYRLHS